MPAHAMPREAAVFVESTFAETQSNWDANATEIYVIAPNVEGVDQAMLDNENIRPRNLFVHNFIPGLKSGTTFTCELYMTAKGSNAAEAAAATADIQASIMKSALGGMDLGYGIGVSGGSASAPELDSDPGFVAGDWVFAVDATTGEGEFYRIEAIAAGPPVVATLDRDLHFTPDGGGADRFYSVIVIYPNEDALNNHDDANHTTLGWLVQGDHADDVYELQGCKPTLSIGGITAGEPVKCSLEHKVTAWRLASAATFTSTPSGIAPNVPGTGDDTYVRLASTATPLTSSANVDCRGTLTPNLGIGWDQVMGPNGYEGVHGHVGTGQGEGGLQLTVEYAAAYDTAFVAGTIYHGYVQVGTVPTKAWAIYWPRLEMRNKPKRSDEGSVTSHALDFRAQESTASVSGLTGDDIDKRRAPFVILRCA